MWQKDLKHSFWKYLLIICKKIKDVYDVFHFFFNKYSFSDQVNRIRPVGWEEKKNITRINSFQSVRSLVYICPILHSNKNHYSNSVHDRCLFLQGEWWDSISRRYCSHLIQMSMEGQSIILFMRPAKGGLKQWGSNTRGTLEVMRRIQIIFKYAFFIPLYVLNT